MENYQKKYTEALDRAKNYHKGHTLDVNPKAAMEYVFPELKESEDGRMIKSLKRLIKAYYDVNFPTPEGFERKDMISWLENQGEQKSQGKSAFEVWKGMRLEVWLQASGNRHSSNFSDESTKMFSLTDIDEIIEKITEKQGEQKPADKVELKFKVGDWVIWDNKISCHIDNIHQGKNSLMYTITDTNNMTRGYGVKGFDNNAHLWTIQDAKYGDVLVSEYGNPFIFNGIVTTRYVGAYGGITTSKEFELCNTTENWTSLNVSPATEEQRKLLFQKMKEAGYEWDAERKELIKIEEKHAWSEKIKGLNELEIYILSLVPDRPLKAIKVDAKNIRHIINKEQNPTAWTDKDWSYYNKLESFLEVKDHYSPTESSSDYQKDVHETLLWLKSLSPKHVAWSEEDEKILHEISQCVYDNVVNIGTVNKVRYIDWLKSLEGRVHPKQEWGDEDEKMFMSLKSLLNEASCYSCTDGVDKILSWLKSLKERYGWKPSKEQIIALRWVLNNVPYNKHKEEISGLLDQLTHL